MTKTFDTGKLPIWICRSRPYDLDAGVERNVWLATEAVESDEPYEGWLSLDSSGPDSASAGDVLQRGSMSFAFGVRFRTDTNQSALLVSKGMSAHDTGDPAYGLGLESPDLVRHHFQSDPSGFVVGTNSAVYADGEWHVLIAVVDRGASGEVRVYFDGALLNSYSVSLLGGLDPTEDLLFGIDSSGGSGFTGDIERVLCWPVAASITDMMECFDSRDLTALIADGSPGEAPDGAWPINEGFGSKIQDVSGSGFHAELSVGSAASPWSAIAPPPGTIPGVLSKPFSLSASLLRGTDLGSHAIPSFGSVGVLNPDGLLDYLLGYSWGNRLLEVRSGLFGQEVSEMAPAWVGQSDPISGATKTELTIGARGIEDRFDVEIQSRYDSGFEPSVIFNGTDNSIGFGNVLNRTTTAFVIGCTFRCSAHADDALYAKKAGIATTSAGYALHLGSGGKVRFSCADGTHLVTAEYTPTGNYADGELHSLVGVRKVSTDDLLLYYDGVLVATQPCGGSLGSLTNHPILFAGRSAALVATGSRESWSVWRRILERTPRRCSRPWRLRSPTMPILPGWSTTSH